jgi:hypothetical protein
LLEGGRIGKGELEPRQEVEGLPQVSCVIETPRDRRQVLEPGGDVVFAHVMGPLRSLRNLFAAGRAVGGAVLVGTGALLFFDRVWWLSVAAHHLQDAIGFP